MKSNLRNFLKFCFMIIIFFIILDSTVGKYVYKKYVREQLLDINPNFSKIDEIYDHKFPKNFNAIGGWGNLRYKLCTDNNGFRTACNKKEKSIKKFDIAFIGDSFTEGLGYDYEQTFVGIIEKKLFDKKIANLSMSSYSPSIYYTKLKKLISEGYEFDEVIVFLDLSDLTDDILCYEVINDQRVVRRNTFETCFNNFNAKEKNKFSQFIERHLKFTHISPSLDTTKAGSKKFRVKFTGPIANDFKDIAVPATEENLQKITNQIEDITTGNLYKNKAFIEYLKLIDFIKNDDYVNVSRIFNDKFTEFLNSTK